jgi:hypothetical protein
VGLAPALSISEAIAEHLSVTEGEHGLYAELVAADPRLTFAIESLLREHTDLRRALHRRLDDAQLAKLGRLLDRHCQRGNDLVYEAYVVDLGGET